MAMERGLDLRMLRRHFVEGFRHLAAGYFGYKTTHFKARAKELRTNKLQTACNDHLTSCKVAIPFQYMKALSVALLGCRASNYESSFGRESGLNWP